MIVPTGNQNENSKEKREKTEFIYKLQDRREFEKKSR